MRLVLSAAFVMLALPVLAGEPYKPLKLFPAELVTPTESLLTSARELLAAIESGDGDAIDARMYERVTAVDGALDLHVRRRKEVIGPTDTIEEMLVSLANYIGGDYQRPDGEDWTPYAIEAERQYIRAALTEPGEWGRDPMIRDAVCTYAYREFDERAVGRLAKQLGTQSSSMFYVDQPTPLLAAAEDGAAVAMTLQPDLLYVLDYDTDAPRRWIAVHMPDGGSGFISFDKVEVQKPYAAGICFTEGREGTWFMSGQASTSL
ncbi:MAG: hypothetical protein ACO1OG_04515 [Devosia sp.]